MCILLTLLPPNGSFKIHRIHPSSVLTGNLKTMLGIDVDNYKILILQNVIFDSMDQIQKHNTDFSY